MTTFTGPVHVRRLDSDVTAIRLDAGGSATFTDTIRASGGIQVGSATTVDGTLNVSGAATFVSKVTAAGGLQVGAATTVDGALNVSGASLFVGNVSAKGDAVVSGRVRSGAGGIGDVVLSQSVTVNCQTATAGTPEVNIPTDAHILDITYHLIDNHFGTAAADISILVGTSGDDDQYATIAASGGVPSVMHIGNANFTGVSGAALHGKAAGGIFIKTTAVSGAVSSKSALLSFSYVRTA